MCNGLKNKALTSCNKWGCSWIVYPSISKSRHDAFRKLWISWRESGEGDTACGGGRGRNRPLRPAGGICQQGAACAEGHPLGRGAGTPPRGGRALPRGEGDYHTHPRGLSKYNIPEARAQRPYRKRHKDNWRRAVSLRPRWRLNKASMPSAI